MGFKPKVTGPNVVAEYTSNVMRVVAHLVEIERRMGVTVTLAIEPEPHCFLETTNEAIAYFDEHLYSGAAVESFAGMAGVPVFKLQLAGALRVPQVGPEDVDRLRALGGTICLTQTVERRAGHITRYLN